ncbi:hypothetical protein LX36DRAFT_658998 [Colletotrichum falcatum]|nr:hypothetical protein LX36DRAFT_658998 [Colletotrichum falcatum]
MQASKQAGRQAGKRADKTRCNTANGQRTNKQKARQLARRLRPPDPARAKTLHCRLQDQDPVGRGVNPKEVSGRQSTSATYSFCFFLFYLSLSLSLFACRLGSPWTANVEGRTDPPPPPLR